ncbi:unnamed protein product [Adineta steineri]|uniref:Copper transport protein n=1 Tax=Adineta steineri TaxID=433720 RepID=A0A814PVB5_9BILA|nr:unnamed protein product [Adineta steineri]CAF1111367.1 unnamed protein product [Adineta steineri]
MMMMMDKCMAMQNGFQFAMGRSQQCILFLFPGLNIDTRIKYALFIIIVFCMGIFNEIIIYSRHLLVQRTNVWSSIFVQQLCISLSYGVHMLFAYCLMLLVMTYDIGIFIALIFGLILGHFIFGIIRIRNRTQINSLTTETTPLINTSSHDHSFSTPCCQTE